MVHRKSSTVSPSNAITILGKHAFSSFFPCHSSKFSVLHLVRLFSNHMNARLLNWPAGLRFLQPSTSFNQDCGPGTQISGFGSSSRDLKILAAASTFWHRLQNYLVHWKLKTIVIMLQVEYVLSTMGVSKESISKFLIRNQFPVKLRILSPYSNQNWSSGSSHPNLLRLLSLPLYESAEDSTRLFCHRAVLASRSNFIVDPPPPCLQVVDLCLSKYTSLIKPEDSCKILENFLDLISVKHGEGASQSRALSLASARNESGIVWRLRVLPRLEALIDLIVCGGNRRDGLDGQEPFLQNGDHAWRYLLRELPGLGQEPPVRWVATLGVLFLSETKVFWNDWKEIKSFRSECLKK